VRSYTVVFVEPVRIAFVAEVAADAFGLDRALIELWDPAAGHDGAEPGPFLAQVAVGSVPGVYAEFVAFDEFADHAGAPALLDVARELAVRVGRRAIIGPESVEDYRWTLVAGDGTHGAVILDGDRFDEGAIAIMGALEPIPGAPDVPVFPAA
jgi:hypothetical protein